LSIGYHQIMPSYRIDCFRACLFLISVLYLYPSILLAEDSNANNEQQNDTRQPNIQPNSSDSGFIFYGNWCGPNHPVDITTAPDPIDLLDNQCKIHDFCYSDKGDFDCGCDRQLVTDLDNNQKKRLFTPEQYLLAQNIKLHFAFSPCNGVVEGNKVLPTRVLTRIYNGTRNRMLNTYDRFIGNRFSGMKRNGDSSNKSIITDKSGTNNK